MRSYSNRFHQKGQFQEPLIDTLHENTTVFCNCAIPINSASDKRDCVAWRRAVNKCRDRRFYLAGIKKPTGKGYAIRLHTERFVNRPSARSNWPVSFEWQLGFLKTFYNIFNVFYGGGSESKVVSGFSSTNRAISQIHTDQISQMHRTALKFPMVFAFSHNHSIPPILQKTRYFAL